MKRTTLTILEEYNNIVTGYVTLFSYRLANLCIKADPLSLLGVTVDIEGTVRNIDDVAVVAAGDNEFEMKVVPLDEENILLIGKGIAEQHIEFRQELDTLTLEDDTECKFIRLSMPEVNEDRKKLMTDAVKLLHDECAAKIKLSTASYKVKIAADIIGEKKEDIEAVNRKFDETTEMYNKTCEDLTKTKNDEISEAFALYQQKQQQQQTEQSERAAAEGKETVSHLKMQ